MGFNFQVGHPNQIFEQPYASLIVKALREAAGRKISLGRKRAYFCLCDEMGWSWWRKLQSYAVATLGAQSASNILATDAWEGMYVDAPIERLVLWPAGRPSTEETDEAAADASSDIIERAIQEMKRELGPRPGEDGALQVGNLVGLCAELDALIHRLGIERSVDLVEELRYSYISDDDRVDDDPHIQCLCHAWLTATKAIEMRAPMWLVK